MLTDMKKQMKEKQFWSDEDQEQAALDRENAACEQEVLKHHND